MIKKPGTYISMVFVLLALISAGYYIAETSKEVPPENIIYTSSEKLKPNIKSFLNNAESTVDKLNAEAKSVNVDQLPVENLNRYFSDLMGQKRQLFGVLLFGRNMNYVIIRNQDSWVYTFNNLTDTIINWQRIDMKLKPVPNGNWTQTYNNFMDEKKFGSVKLKVSRLKGDECMWIAAQSSLPDRNDLLFNVFRLHTKSDTSIAALIYKTSELGNRFSKVLLFDNPLISIITKNGDVVSPMKAEDTASISKLRKLESYVIGNEELWEKEHHEQPHTYLFTEFNKNYFTRIDTITPEVAVKAFALTISEADLINSRKMVHQAYLYAVLLFLLFALFAYLNTYNRYRKNKRRKTDDLKPLSLNEIRKMINGGESEYVEYKSSLRWDYQQESVNIKLEEVIMKSVAAFSNAKGGTLFIGVRDDNEIIGLEPDFKTLKKQDADYFEMHLRRMINNQYGIRFSNEHLLMQLPIIDEKTICVIQILPGSSALFLKTKNKQGQNVEKFYVRSGNASHQITSLTELNDYVKERFNSKN